LTSMLLRPLPATQVLCSHTTHRHRHALQHYALRRLLPNASSTQALHRSSRTSSTLTTARRMSACQLDASA
jgi:hypothetical protein